MRWWRCLVGAAATVLAAVSPLPGQSAADFVAQGIKAYHSLDYGAASGLLRRALAAQGEGDSLSRSERTRAFSYLAASDLYRGRRDSAFAVFRRLVAFDPRFRPDKLVFPPEVTTIYEFAREATKLVVAEYPADTVLSLTFDAYPLHLLASSFHQILVTLNQEDGSPIRTLYSGPISDSLDVRWDGSDTAGLAGDSGAFLLSIASSTGGATQEQRVLRLRLSVRLLRRDTLPIPAAPPDSLLLPERTPGHGAKRSLVQGGLVAAGVLILPGLVAKGAGPAGPPAFVATGIAAAGLAGFFTQRHGKPLPDNIAANQVVRAHWQADRDSLVQENANRKRDVRLNVHASPPEVIGGAP